MASVIARFVRGGGLSSGEATASTAGTDASSEERVLPSVELSVGTSVSDLNVIVNALLRTEARDKERTAQDEHEKVLYSFFVNNEEVTESLSQCEIPTEQVGWLFQLPISCFFINFF